MPKRIIISLFIACTILSFVLFENQIHAASKKVVVTDTISYNKANSAYFFDIIKTDDGFIAVGLDDLSTEDEIITKAIIVKYNNDFVLEWDHILDASSLDGYKSVIGVDDGYLVVGYTLFENDNYKKLRKNKNEEDTTSDIVLVHYSKDGEVKKVKSYGGTDEDYINQILKVEDGFLLIGESNSDDKDLKSKNHGLSDGVILKLDLDLKPEWTFNFGGSKKESLVYAFETNDGYIAVGKNESNDQDLKSNSGDEDALIVKINKEGKLSWYKTYGGSKQDGFISIIPLTTGFAASGYTLSNDIDFEQKNPNEYATMLLTFDNDGEMLNLKTDSGDGLAFFPMKNYEDGILVSGKTTTDTGYENIFAKLDEQGNKLWDSKFSGTEKGGIENYVITDTKIIAINYDPDISNFLFLEEIEEKVSKSQLIISIAIATLAVVGFTIYLLKTKKTN